MNIKPSSNCTYMADGSIYYLQDALDSGSYITTNTTDRAKYVNNYSTTGAYVYSTEPIYRDVDAISVEYDGISENFTKDNIVSMIYQLKSIKESITKLYNNYYPGMGEITNDKLVEKTKAIVDALLGENNE